MRVAHERSFSTDSPVGRYWLLNSVGFRVEGPRGRRTGVVEEVGLGPNGVDVLAVRRRVVLGRRLVLIPAERVESVFPWEEAITLSSRRRRSRDQRAASLRRVERKLEAIAAASAVATGHSVRSFAGAVRRGAVVVLRLLRAWLRFLVQSLRRHSPRVRGGMTRGTGAVGTILRAYAWEARRALRNQRRLIAEWRALRNGQPPPIEDAHVPTTETETEAQAGTEDLGTRRREAIGR